MQIQLLEEEHAAARQAVEITTAAGEKDPEAERKRIEEMQKSIEELEEEEEKGQKKIADLEEGRIMLDESDDETFAQVQQKVREIRGLFNLGF